jgi:hypothetical protein
VFADREVEVEVRVSVGIKREEEAEEPFEACGGVWGGGS